MKRLYIGKSKDWEGEWKKFVRREECVRSQAPELSTGGVVKIQRWQAQTGWRESGIIRKGSREKNMSRRKRRPDKQQAKGRAVEIQRWQVQTRWRESGIIRKGSREKNMSSTKRRPDKQEATGKAFEIQNWQGQTGSRESGIIRQDAEGKKCQGQRVPRDDTVNSRASQAARRRSSRLSLSFLAFSPFQNFHYRLPGLCL